MKLLPKLLSEEEASWWGLTEMLPEFPSEEILLIEAKWSKKDLQRMADENYLNPGGDKELLVSKLLYIGVLDSEGGYIEQEFREREPVGEMASLPQTKKPAGVTPAAKERMPRINPHASALKQDEQLRKQMKWLKEHGFKTAREAQEAGY